MNKQCFLFLMFFAVFNLTCSVNARPSTYVSSIKISSDEEIQMTVGDKIALTAVVTPEGTDGAYMKWLTNNYDVIELNAPDSNVLLSPPKGTAEITALKAGTATVTVYSSTFPNTDEYSEASDEITITVSESINENTPKYEIYNNGVFTGISSILKYYIDGKTKPILYLNINDISKLGLDIKDIENGISISNGIKKAEIEFAADVLNLDNYSFKDPIINLSNRHFLMLDIIGKCFSDQYGDNKVNNVWQIYLLTEHAPVNYTDQIIIKSTTLNFLYNVYSIQLQNESYYEFDDIKIYTSYYSKDGKLLDINVSELYTIEPKEELTTFIPINDSFDDATTIKIMLWANENIPITNFVVLKNYCFDSTIKPPEEKPIIFSDIDINSKYYDVTYIMNSQNWSLGMFKGYEDGTYMPDGNITKSEFCYVLSGFIGLDFENTDIDCRLTDVPSSHWCKDAAGYIVSKGIMPAINGYFYPDKYITLNEVLSAFLKVLGETDFETNTIMNLSEKHNLLKNVNVEETEITRGNFTQLAYNFMMEYSR